MLSSLKKSGRQCGQPTLRWQRDNNRRDNRVYLEGKKRYPVVSLQATGIYTIENEHLN